MGCPGLYLVADGDRYRGGCISGRVPCYSPDRIDAAVDYVRANGFPEAKKVDRRDALNKELAFAKDLLVRLEALPA